MREERQDKRRGEGMRRLTRDTVAFDFGDGRFPGVEERHVVLRTSLNKRERETSKEKKERTSRCTEREKS
jgi:hypothetical protein